jgi:TPR repeat protein
MNMQMHGTVTAELPEGLFERGLAYSAGRGGRVDLIEAHKWFNLAALRGDRTAAAHREELASEMTREEIAAALKAAREWMSRH